jgi:hypothetical protein
MYHGLPLKVNPFCLFRDVRNRTAGRNSVLHVARHRYRE